MPVHNLQPETLKLEGIFSYQFPVVVVGSGVAVVIGIAHGKEAPAGQAYVPVVAVERITG